MNVVTDPALAIDDVSPWRRLENRFKMRTAFVVTHSAALLLAIPTYSSSALVVCLVACLITLVGIEVGFHRLLAHRAFETPSWVRYLLVLCGTFGAQEGPLAWVSTHRHHHRHSDDPDSDPHTPRRSLLHAHIGWMRGNPGLMRSPAYFERWVPDLYRDPVLRWVDATELFIVMAPVPLLYALGGWGWVVWGYLVRMVIVWHLISSLNSICHRFGKQEFSTGDASRNVWWLALPTLGQSYHNNHHYAPSSAQVGFHWWQIDLGWYFIWVLEKMGLASNVRRRPA